VGTKTEFKCRTLKVKALIIMSPVDSKEDFIARIVKAAATIRKKPGIFESHQSL